MASYMLIRHKIRDFTQWKQVYDEHRPKREEAGLTERYLLRGAEDPHEVFLLLEARDLGRARQFAESADLREIMQKAGVIGQPEVQTLND